MFRPAFNFVSNLSLLLLVTMTAICLSGVYLGSVRSVGWMATYTNRDGNIGLAVITDSSADTTGRVFDPVRDYEVVTGNMIGLTGFRGRNLLGVLIRPAAAQPPTSLSGYMVLVPWWWWSGLLATLPAIRLATWWVNRLVRRHRQAEGLCPACRYDLRASPGPYCPECGNPIDRPASNPA